MGGIFPAEFPKLLDVWRVPLENLRKGFKIAAIVA
jgi:hypothetical protein